MSVPTDIAYLPNQKARLLKLLQFRGQQGVKVYEITNSRPDGLGILQYSARISELRDDGYEIENNPGWFVLHGYESDKTIEKEYIPEEVQKPDEWLKMGAWLRGNGNKPQINTNLESSVQAALL
jgi:hypothetical protein